MPAQSKPHAHKPSNKKPRAASPTRRRKKEACAPAEPPTKPFKVIIDRDTDYWKPLGIFAGDVLTMTPATNLQPRRIVAVYRHAGALEDDGRFDFGRFVRYESDVEFDGLKGKHPAIVIEDAEGDELEHNLDTWSAYSFTFTPRAQAHGSSIAALRAKLDKLDDITDCSQRFKIEREIYELERQTITDEWPEVIYERSAGDA